MNRLISRAFPGNQELHEDLLADLRQVPLEGHVLPVDLEMLSSLLDGELDISTGAYVDRHTGEVYGDFSADPAMVGEDMAAFAATQHSPSRREQLEQAIDSKGALARFRDRIGEEGLVQRWQVFSTDRRLGRARHVLAAERIRVR